MLSPADLVIAKNSEGIATALGYPINSLLLQQNKPLFGGGKKKIHRKGKGNDRERDEEEEYDYDNLAIPAGLVCTTETICRQPEMMVMNAESDEDDVIPEGLYEKLLELAETTQPKKLTRRRAVTHKKSKAKSQKQRAVKKRNV